MSLDVCLVEESDEVFSANVTHNLASMAEAAGIYPHLWRPVEVGVRTAVDLVDPLRAGLQRLVAQPAHFERYSATNGWGKLEHFVHFVAQVLAACIAHPNAAVEVSR